MAFSDIDVCSNALAILGEGPISSFDDQTSPHSNTCSIRYPMLRDSILSGYPWKFTITQALLSKKVTTPEVRYKYIHSLPPDRVNNSVIALYRTDNTYETPFNEFIIQGDEVHSNESVIYIDYQKANVPESEWPTYFVDFMAHALATDLAMSVTKKIGIKQEMERTTYGARGRGSNGGLEAKTQSLDAKSSPANNRLHDFPLVTARYSSVGD